MKRVRPGWLLALGILTAAGLQAQSTVARPTRAPTTRIVPLPDPTLLLGSDYPPDEYPEYGMIGTFDLPGDNSTGPQDQVSGAGNPVPDQTGNGAPQDQQNVGQGSGNPGNAENSQQPPAGGEPGGSQPTGEEAVASSEEGSGAASEESEANAIAQGVQVAELIMDGNFEQGDPPPPSNSAQNVSIGDSAMVIQSSTAQSDVVGSIPAGNTQQADRQVAGGGAGVTNSTNRGTERGSDMPEGL